MNSFPPFVQAQAPLLLPGRLAGIALQYWRWSPLPVLAQPWRQRPVLAAELAPVWHAVACARLAGRCPASQRLGAEAELRIGRPTKLGSLGCFDGWTDRL
jgi:hypothetical protein